MKGVAHGALEVLRGLPLDAPDRFAWVHLTQIERCIAKGLGSPLRALPAAFRPAARCAIHLVHTSQACRRQGIAAALLRRAQQLAPAAGGLSASSPMCTSLTAARMYVRAGFVVDAEVFDAAFCWETTLTVAWQHSPRHAAAHEDFVRRAARERPELL